MLRRKTIILPIGGGGGNPQTGTLNISAEGTYDVSQYAEVDVDVPYTDDYLCFTAEQPNCIIGITRNNDHTPNIEYSFDKTNWTTWDYSNITLQSTGDKVYMRGYNPMGFNFSNRKLSTFYIPYRVSVTGDLLTILNYKKKMLILPSNCFNSLFFGTAILSAPKCEATEIGIQSFNYTYASCTSLVNAPALPATKLAKQCYFSMFSGCTSLVNAPALPATNIPADCYSDMFQGCSALTTAPSLSHVTTLADYCFQGMFRNCTSLVTAPALPSTSLKDGCFKAMFKNCTSLVNAPIMPVHNTIRLCYQEMFSGCSSLVTAPALPSTALSTNCYQDMFRDCTSLVNAPALPATTLAQYCYYGMFRGCTSLTTAPELPARTLVLYCYTDMFFGCSSLNDVTTYAENWDESHYTVNWLAQVPQSGTFKKLIHTTIPTNDPSGIPYGWTVSYLDIDYFYIENIYNGQNTITLKKNGTPTTGTTLEWSSDKSTWTIVTYDANNEFSTAIPNQNQRIYLRSSDGLSQSTSNYYQVYTSNNVNTGGDLKTLIDYNDPTIDTIPSYNFYKLFYPTTSSKTPKVVDASDIRMDGIIYVDSEAFHNTFSGCTTLITPIRELPATYGAYQCYTSMFRDCTALTSAPVIKLDSVWTGKNINGMMTYMFSGCIALTSVDLSNIQFMGQQSALSMFEGCTSLHGPVVINNQGTANSFANMFKNCSSLNDIRYLGSRWNTSYANNWVSGVAATGDFYNLGQATIPTGTNGIPTGWTEHTQLPVTFLSYIHKDVLENQVDSGAKSSDKIDTLICPPNGNYSFRLKGKFKGKYNGLALCGVVDHNNPLSADDVKFRAFSYGGLKYFDCGNQRFNAYRFTYDEDVDITVTNCKYHDNISGNDLYFSSTQTLTPRVGYTFLVDCSTWWLKSVEIFDENGNTVFNGTAAVSNGVYGLWDSVTNQMFTNTTINIVGEV